MKKITLVIFLFIISMLLLACTDKQAEQNMLEFYLVSGELTQTEDINIDGLTLEDEPILTIDDIQKYYWDEQTFIMAKDIIREHLNKRPDELAVPVQGLAYVAVVNGERVYMGKFWTMLSSLWMYNPSIFVDGTIGKNDGQYNLEDSQQLYAVQYDESDKEVEKVVYDERIYRVLEQRGILANR